MKTNNIRLAVVGYGMPVEEAGLTCGRGGGLFKEAVKKFDGITPAAICDTERACLKQAKKDFPRSRLYSDFDKMIKDAQIDAVIIGTPATYHAELAGKALRHNIHVLSEIPSVWSIDEGEQLWKAHLKSKALYMTGSNPNFKGYFDAAVDLKKKGLFGDPIYVEAEYIHDCRSYWTKTPWRMNLEPVHYCTHSLGPVLRLIDEDLEWVSCFDSGSHINKAKGQHDVMAALFRTRSNVVVRLLVSFITEVAAQHVYRFFTTKGSFERTARQLPSESPRTLFYSKDLPILSRHRVELPVGDMPVKYASNPKATGHGGVDYAMLDVFFNAIREGLPSPISLKEGLRMTLPGIYAAESARKGGELVRIRYPWSKKE